MIQSTDAQLASFFAADQSRPVMFVNCHRYHTKACYPEGYGEGDLDLDVSGFEAYHRYLSAVEARFLPQVGGRFVVVGPIAQVLIGDGQWDELIIGEYPSRAEAMRMPTLPGYDAIAIHRSAGLAEALTFALSQDALTHLAVADAWRYRRSAG